MGLYSDSLLLIDYDLALRFIYKRSIYFVSHPEFISRNPSLELHEIFPISLEFNLS